MDVDAVGAHCPSLHVLIIAYFNSSIISVVLLTQLMYISSVKMVVFII